MLISRRRRDSDEALSRVESDRNTVTLRTYHAAFPESLLKTDNIYDGAKSWGQRRDHSRIKEQIPEVAANLPGGNRLFDYVAVLGLSRKSLTTLPTDDSVEVLPSTARCIIDNYQDPHFPQVVSTSFASTNIIPFYGSPDDSGLTNWKILNQILNPPDVALVGGYTPSQLRPTNGTLDTQITFRAGGSAARPFSGIQEILVHVANSADPATYPIIITKIRQGGVDLSTLTNDWVEKTSHGYIYRYTWNASILTSSTSAVEFNIVGKTIGASSVSFMGFCWRAAVSGTLYDSGFTKINKDFKVWCPQLRDIASTEMFVLVEFSDWVKTTVTTVLDPLGGPAAFNVLNKTPLDQPLQIGRYLSGVGYDIPLLASNGYNLRKAGNNQGALYQTYGGHRRASRSDLTWTEADFNLKPQSQLRFFTGNDEAASPHAREVSIEQVFQEVGFVLPLLFIPDPNLPDTAIWATISNLEVPDLGRMVGNDLQDPRGSSALEKVTALNFEDERFSIRMTATELCARPTART